MVPKAFHQHYCISIPIFTCCGCVVLSSYYLVCFVTVALFWLFFFHLDSVLRMWRTGMFCGVIFVPLPLMYHQFTLLHLLPLIFIFLSFFSLIFHFCVHNFRKINPQQSLIKIFHTYTVSNGVLWQKL